MTMAKPFNVMAFMKEAKDLGMSAEDISNQIRDEHAAARELRKQELEYAEPEKQRKENQKQREENEKKRAHDIATFAEAERQCEHDLALASLGQSDTNRTNSGARTDKPRIPPFDDAIDNMDAYLLRFERLASATGWESSNFAIYLGTL